MKLFSRISKVIKEETKSSGIMADVIETGKTFKNAFVAGAKAGSAAMGDSPIKFQSPIKRRVVAS
ncbi:hypothetical protein JEZ13_04150 [bacterium]|nr:hypothetical protein [bacterium]MBI9072948.1 hypothetical protein [Melioribacteraceae bacterium]